MIQTIKKIWEKGIEAEVQFWDEWFQTKGIFWPEDYAFRMDPQAPFQEYLIRYLPTEKKTIDILDVGSGPVSYLGKTLPGTDQQIRIIATDPLADRYMMLLRKFNIHNPITTIKANAELLTDFFPSDYFDFVYMRNALDHSFDPVIAVGQMIEVLAPDRYLILQHENNEAENEKYQDLHQWNIQIEDGEFIIWNKSTRYNLSTIYSEVANIRCEKDETFNFIEILKK